MVEETGLGIRKVVLNSNKPTPDTREHPDEYDIDGYIHIEKDSRLHTKVAFRRKDKGGVGGEDEPTIACWKNPSRPLDNITLVQTFNIMGDTYVISDGEVKRP